jgi:hypothetical protein
MRRAARNQSLPWSPTARAASSGRAVLVRQASPSPRCRGGRPRVRSSPAHASGPVAMPSPQSLQPHSSWPSHVAISSSRARSPGGQAELGPDRDPDLETPFAHDRLQRVVPAWRFLAESIGELREPRSRGRGSDPPAGDAGGVSGRGSGRSGPSRGRGSTFRRPAGTRSDVDGEHPGKQARPRTPKHEQSVEVH